MNPPGGAGCKELNPPRMSPDLTDYPKSLPLEGKGDRLRWMRCYAPNSDAVRYPIRFRGAAAKKI